VWKLAISAGYALGNVDATIVAQAPRLAPHVPAMIANLTADLGASAAQVSVKATTTEHLGFTGRGEGIAAMASVLLVSRR
jgi:2-C-methyl-D-erythritol 2,4-cyclodiphosphate synthase